MTERLDLGSYLYIRELEDAVVASDPFQIMPLTRRILASRPEDLEAVGIVGCYCEPRSEQ